MATFKEKRVRAWIIIQFGLRLKLKIQGRFVRGDCYGTKNGKN